MSECKFKASDGECLHDKMFPYKEYCVDGPCPHYTAQTNADHIRSMTDEELAEWIAHPKVCYCQYETCDGVTDCTKCCLEWLKQEIKE